MQEAIASVKAETDAFEEVKPKKKKDKKANKRKAEEMEIGEPNGNDAVNGINGNGVHKEEEVEGPKKKKKRSDAIDLIN